MINRRRAPGWNRSFSVYPIRADLMSPPLTERWTTREIRARNIAGGAIFYGVFSSVAVGVILLLLGASIPAAVVNMMGLALIVPALIVGVVINKYEGRARKEICRDYGIPPKERPNLVIYSIRSVDDFDSWLTKHGKSVSDRRLPGNE